jgi:hypothetical protein
MGHEPRLVEPALDLGSDLPHMLNFFDIRFGAGARRGG